MAGDWIKMRVNLVAHPKVLRIAEVLLSDQRFLDWSVLSYSLTGYPPSTGPEIAVERHAALRVTRYVVVSSLLRFWGYANEHAKGEKIDSVTRQDVDDIAGVPGFSDALSDVGWAKFDDSIGGVVLPAFREHNVSADERKSSGAERQKRYRERLKQRTQNRDVTSDVTLPEREEKRREDKPIVLSEAFTRFWSTWPKSSRKGGKSKCQEVWAKGGFDETADAIIAHVETMKLSLDWRKNGGEFIPAPLVYLNGRKWDGAETATPEPRRVAV